MQSFFEVLKIVYRKVRKFMKYIASIILSAALLINLSITAMTYDVEKELNDKQKATFNSTTFFTKRDIKESCFLAMYYSEKLRNDNSEDRKKFDIRKLMSKNSETKILYKKYLENAEQCMLRKKRLDE